MNRQPLFCTGLICDGGHVAINVEPHFLRTLAQVANQPQKWLQIDDAASSADERSEDDAGCGRSESD